VIPVLQAPGGVAPDGLEMGSRIRRVEHVLVSRRHGQASEAPHGVICTSVSEALP